MRHAITERAQQLAVLAPTEHRPRCEGVCRFLFVEYSETRGVRVWRCEACLRYVEAPISPVHDAAVASTPRAPLPDQVTIYDLLEREEGVHA